MALALSDQPDLVLVDIGLRDIDGYEVARRLRNRLGHDVQLVALPATGRRPIGVIRRSRKHLLSSTWIAAAWGDLAMSDSPCGWIRERRGPEVPHRSGGGSGREEG
jgi:hypothetical protein